MEKVRVNVRRVLKGDEDVHPVSTDGVCRGIVPANGFVVYLANGYGIPLYVRDDDLYTATQKRAAKDRSIPVEAQSWTLTESEQEEQDREFAEKATALKNAIEEDSPNGGR